MKEVIEELWDSNFYENIRCREMPPTEKELMAKIANSHDGLLRTLTDEQKKLLEIFNDCYSELSEITERNIFAYAFKLGARLAIEVMSFRTE